MAFARLATAMLVFLAPMHAAAQIYQAIPYDPLPPPRSYYPEPPQRLLPPKISGAIPNSLPCSARGPGGKLVDAKHRSGLSGYIAHSNWDAFGWPTITYSRTYFTLSPVVQRFTSLHECGHLSLGNRDEFVANCYALRNGNFTASEIAEIKGFHQRIGIMPSAYGGSGNGFWRRTIAVCSEFAGY